MTESCVQLVRRDGIEMGTSFAIAELAGISEIAEPGLDDGRGKIANAFNPQ
jgi:hypothetical protein